MIPYNGVAFKPIFCQIWTTMENRSWIRPLINSDSSCSLSLCKRQSTTRTNTDLFSVGILDIYARYLNFRLRKQIVGEKKLGLLKYHRGLNHLWAWWPKLLRVNFFIVESCRRAARDEVSYFEWRIQVNERKSAIMIIKEIWKSTWLTLWSVLCLLMTL